MWTKTQQIIAELAGSFEKMAMHGYPDYQMTDPQTPPVPQQSLPVYEPEDQEEPEGPLSKIPGRAIGVGAFLGGQAGKGLLNDRIQHSSQEIGFLMGNSPSQVNARLLQALQSGEISSEAIPAARQGLSSPSWLKENLFESPAAYDAALKGHRMDYWKALGKGPGLGVLGGALAGLGGGLLYNHLKESSERGLLWKEAFRAPPPVPDIVPSAWNNHLTFNKTRMAYAPTQVGPNPLEHPQMSEALHAAPGATRVARTPGLLSRLQSGATMVARHRV